MQFAKACGATVILTSSSDEKRATPAWDEQVLKLTEGRCADLVVGTAGAATIARALNAAAVAQVVVCADNHLEVA